MISATQLHPTTKINLRDIFSFETNESARMLLHSILIPGHSAAASAYLYMKAIGSSQPFKLDSHVVVDEQGQESLEWWLRIYSSPEEDGILPWKQAPYGFNDPEQEIDDEFDCEAEREL